MGEVSVVIDGIILYTNESILGIQLGNGYSIAKMYLDDFLYKEKIVNGDGRLSIDYLGSELLEDNRNYFMCIHKEDSYQIQLPEIKPGVIITDKDTMCEQQLEDYKEEEMQYLNKKFSLLHLFKSGNIGCKEIFLEHRFNAYGFIHHRKKQTSTNISRNIVDSRIYKLDENELVACNDFLNSYSGVEYDLLKACIDEFTWGLEQVDIPTGFEQYTTALEMIFLGKNQQGKKEVLAKRVSVLIETDPIKTRELYEKMKNFYRYRSESLHEGDGRNITKAELYEMEDIVRNVLAKYLSITKNALQNYPEISWDEIKDEQINILKVLVSNAIIAGTLPA